MSPFTVLVVDDYEPFCRSICSMLRKAGFEVVGQSSDGLDAVQKAQELQPDLILVDIGLPNLNGIEAAKRMRELAPHSRILFLSQESSSEVVQEALNLGALAYVHKSRVPRELLPAIESVLAGRQFVSGDLKGYGLRPSKNANSRHRHEVQFYSDDAVFLESFTRFIAVTLKAGNSAIAVVTKSLRHGLLMRLKAQGVDVDAAIQRGTYVALDAAETLSTIMLNGLPDRVRFFQSICTLIDSCLNMATAKHLRVAMCGERVGLLWAKGNTDGALRLEQLCNELIEAYDVDMLCAYPLDTSQAQKSQQKLKSICAEHSAVLMPSGPAAHSRH